MFTSTINITNSITLLPNAVVSTELIKSAVINITIPVTITKRIRAMLIMLKLINNFFARLILT